MRSPHLKARCLRRATPTPKSAISQTAKSQVSTRAIAFPIISRRVSVARRRHRQQVDNLAFFANQLR